jgi:hypothetical protein
VQSQNHAAACSSPPQRSSVYSFNLGCGTRVRIQGILAGSSQDDGVFALSFSASLAYHSCDFLISSSV